MEMESEFKTNNFLLLYVKTYYRLLITPTKFAQACSSTQSPVKIKVEWGMLRDTHQL